MVQEEDSLWIAYPSGYDYAQWGMLEKMEPTVLSHLERRKGSFYQDAEYKYKTCKQPHYDYSVQRKPKRRANHAIDEHLRLLKLQGDFDIEEDVWYIERQELQQAKQQAEAEAKAKATTAAATTTTTTKDVRCPHCAALFTIPAA